MTLDTITMDPAAAKQAYRDYQAAVRADRVGVRSHWKAQDVALARGYKHLAKGRALLNVHTALRTAGLREDGYPKLAVCRSDFTRCLCIMGWSGGVTFTNGDRAAWGRLPKAECVRVADGTFPIAQRQKGDRVSTLVPIIPPALRPTTNLDGFHTLWEVESWTLEPPRDPLLLRHLGGDLYVVLAVWDLTELERAVLGGRAR